MAVLVSKTRGWRIVAFRACHRDYIMHYEIIFQNQKEKLKMVLNLNLYDNISEIFLLECLKSNPNTLEINKDIKDKNVVYKKPL